MKKKAFITGINGQDGSYLAELLLEKDYEVYGIIRRNSVAENQWDRINHFDSNCHIEYAIKISDNYFDLTNLNDSLLFTDGNHLHKSTAVYSGR